MLLGRGTTSTLVHGPQEKAKRPAGRAPPERASDYGPPAIVPEVGSVLLCLPRFHPFAPAVGASIPHQDRSVKRQAFQYSREEMESDVRAASHQLTFHGTTRRVAVGDV